MNESHSQGYGPGLCEAGSVPDISIIIPAYNAEGTLHDAVASVLRQRAARFELIVVDDGSSDDTLRIAKALASEHEGVTVLTQENAGTAAALNAGREASKAAVIAHLDADDLLSDDYLEVMTDFVASNPNYDIYSHDLWRIHEDGRTSRVFGWETVRSLSLEEFLIEGAVAGPGTMVRRDLFERVGGYRRGAYNEDYEFWLRALVSGARHIYCPRPLYYYRERADQKTADRERTQASTIEILEDSIARGVIPEELRPTAVASLANYRRRMGEMRLYGGKMEGEVIRDGAEAGAARLRGLVEKAVPAARVDGALRVIHLFTRLVRPVREALWKLRAMNAARRRR